MEGLAPLFWYTEGRNLFLMRVSIFCLLFRYQFRPPVKEEMSSTISCTRIDACGDDVRRDCRLAGVERCRNRTPVLCFLKHSIS